MDRDGMNPELDDLQRAWMVDDIHEGVVEALNGCSDHTLIVAEVTPTATYPTPTIDAHVGHDHVATATCRPFGPRIKNV